MMLTAVDTVQKIVEAFDLGADDYLVKPFMLEILLARLGAISRRQQSTEPSTLRAGDLILDRNHRTVVQNGRAIHLTRKQCDLLDLLMRRRGLVTSREELIEAGWGHQVNVKENALDVYVHGLRSKLESSANGQQELIRTIHGTGYMLVDQ
jgi:two-component system copper resistance phosphate regulon response regulator CusR